jgi:hypothetical protein
MKVDSSKFNKPAIELTIFYSERSLISNITSTPLLVIYIFIVSVKCIMSSKSEIRVTSKHSHEFSSNITVDNITYHVQTEDMGSKVMQDHLKYLFRGRGCL